MTALSRRAFLEVAPGTRFVVGRKFMNVDIARLLDEEYSKQTKPGS